MSVTVNSFLVIQVNSCRGHTASAAAIGQVGNSSSAEPDCRRIFRAGTPGASCRKPNGACGPLVSVRRSRAYIPYTLGDMCPGVKGAPDRL